MFDGRANQFWGALARNIDWFRRRASRLEYLQGQLNEEPITSDGGAIMHAPADDGDTPAAPPGAPAMRTLFQESARIRSTLQPF